MMDTAIAAPLLTVDPKVQAKQGGKADKADAAGKRAAFQDALSLQTPTKGQSRKQTHAHPGEAGADPLEGVMPADSGTKPDHPLPRVQKGLPLFSAPQGAKVPALSELAKAVANQAGEGLRHPGPAGARHMSAARTPDPAEAVDIATDPADGDASETSVPGSLKPPHGGPVRPGKAHAARSGAEEEPAPGADRDAPAKDALTLLVDAGAVHPGIAAPSARPDAEAGQGKAPDGGQPEGGPSHSYRVSRADGKGGVLDIPGAVQEDKSRLSAPANVVTVLDQRRYLAPAQDSNTLSVIHSISADPEWASAMQPGSALANEASQAGGGKVVNTLKIQMHPIDLGLVTATMRLAGDQLTVDLKVETGAAYRQLKEDQSRIIDALKSQGFNVDQVSVSMAPERAETPGGQTGSQTGQQPGGQGASFAQQQEARSGGQAGRGRGGLEQERAGNGTVSTDAIRTEGNGAGSGGASRSGSVYL
nr:flagellar hook-length control protein FliK [uncultured Gellertiella sp.]